ncbi:hypothetical protein NDU88_004565 [Pleurodeles waltl]|uniref:Uncharacterized protein n=1 Tax=Pleurodeles waltl TaxID=8319 RepID=A0AAV7SJA2_PLEWA|nr:hypothetical protein NDU88_004565 [Pleurodeles waltl]
MADEEKVQAALALLRQAGRMDLVRVVALATGHPVRRASAGVAAVVMACSPPRAGSSGIQACARGDRLQRKHKEERDSQAGFKPPRPPSQSQLDCGLVIGFEKRKSDVCKNQDLRIVLRKASDLVTCCDRRSTPDQKQNSCASVAAGSRAPFFPRDSQCGPGPKANVPFCSTKDRRPPDEQNTVKDQCICFKGAGVPQPGAETPHFHSKITTDPDQRATAADQGAQANTSWHC